MKFPLYFLLFLIIFACDSDDDSMSSSSMVVEKNGVTYSIDSYYNSVSKVTENGNTQTYLHIRGGLDDGHLVLEVSNWDWQNPPENGILTKTYDTNNEVRGNNADVGPNTDCTLEDEIFYCDRSEGLFIIGEYTYATAYVEDGDRGRIQILENDTINQTVSGSFEFVTYSYWTKEYISFDGTFENLEYVIETQP